MSILATARALPGSSARGAAGQAVAGLLVAAVAAGLTAYVTTRATLIGVAALLVIAGSQSFATTRRTSLALALLMVYLGALDGYLKLSTGSNLVTFVRDALLYAIVIGLLVRATVQHKRLAAPPLSGWVIGFVVIVLIQLFNPEDGSLFHSLAGARQNLEFVPLFFLTFAFVRTTKALRLFVILLVLLAAANGAANFVQFHLTPQQLSAWGPGYAQRVLGTGGFALAGRNFYSTSGQDLTRPFGLMSDAGSGGLVAALALGGILALATMRARRRDLALAAIAAIAAVTGIVTSQGRAVVVCSVVIVVAYALVTATSRRGIATVLVVGTVAAASFVGLGAISSSSQSSALRYQGLSVANILQTTNQARGSTYADIPRYFAKFPLGAGLGVAGPASGTSGAPAQADNVDAENEILFTTLETGIPGMLIVTGFTAVLFVLGVRRCRQEADPEARLWLAAITAPLAGMLALYLVNAVTPTTPCGPYLWAVGGIVSYWLVARPAALRGAVAADSERVIE